MELFPNASWHRPKKATGQVEDWMIRVFFFETAYYLEWRFYGLPEYIYRHLPDIGSKFDDNLTVKAWDYTPIWE